MKKLFFLFLMAVLCMGGYAQGIIDPLLTEEMGRRGDDEKINVVVIMKSHYDRTQLNRRADYYVTRAERREFVVNELKEFANASQYDLRHSLADMQRHGMTTEPTILWMANALSFSATKEAIQDLANRTDIAMIGYAIERNWIPDGEEAKPASATREITPNVTQVKADQVWALGYTGEGVVVAVIDTGVNYNHVDVADHLWDGGTEFPHHGYDVKNNDNDPMDDHGHGSHCSGTVCGDGTAGSQTGMAPDATLMCVKCLDSSGNGGAESISAGIQWAVEHGCDMFSMSLGIASSTIPERTLLRHTCEAALDAGIVAAIAAGNEGSSQWQFPIPNNVRVPGSCPPPYMDEVQGENPGGHTCSVCIGAVDYNDNAAYFTSRGPVTWTNTEFGDYPYQPEIGLIRPDVCAPGVDIKSLNYTSNTGYTTMSGTSMATPCVAGCIALMLSKDLSLTPAEVCRILEETALTLEPGKSNTYGFGRVNVLDAVEAIQLGSIKYESHEITEVEGNNNHHLNPGESATMSLTLSNITDQTVSGVSVILTTEETHVTITDDEVEFPSFTANQIQTVEDAFAFSVDDEVTANQKLKFDILVYIDGVIMGRFGLDVFVYDYLLEYGGTAVLNDDNGNGLLDPGENADLRILIDNIGNEMAQNVVGTLSTDYAKITLNETQKDFSTVGANMMAYADFNVTLDATAPENFVIPFDLDVVDVHGRHTSFRFYYKNACSVIFSLHDSYGDGWQGNYLQVVYSDGTPTEQLTVNSGSSATYVRELASASTITLSWHNGEWTEECSFEITYEDGTVIFENTGGFSGTKTFTIDCTGGGNAPWFCNPVQNLTYELDDHDVVLSWDVPRGQTPSGYEVYRETLLLATVEGELTYTDPDMEDGTYNYCVYAVYEDCQSEFVCLVAEVTSCAPVQNLDYILDNDLLLTLTWDEPEITAGLIEYQVYMDEELMGSTNELTYAFTIGTGEHDINVRAVFESCELDSHVGVCVVGAVEDLNYLNMEGHYVHVLWNPISGISEYEVYVNGEWVETVEGNLYVAEFEPGLTVVMVEPVAEGCYVLSSSIEVCVIDPIENIAFSDLDGELMMSCSWDPVAYAEYYSVIVNGEAVTDQLTEPHYTFAPQVGANEVCVIATSIYGCYTWPYECATQMVYAAVDGFDYSFDGNKASLSWNGDAPSYAVQLDNLDEEIVESNTFLKEVTDGDHLLTVTPIYPDGPAFPAQFMFTVTNLVPEIQITEVHEGIMATAWNAVEGAIAYNLYRDDELMSENLTVTAYSDHEMPINAVHCYAVQAVFEKGVSDLSEGACANYFQGVDENEGKVKLFPNPTSDKVTVECEGMTRIDIYSLDGKLVQSLEVKEDTCQIDQLESGVYVLRIVRGDEVFIRRVVKR
jgi:subtilisin family serine protease